MSLLSPVSQAGRQAGRELLGTPAISSLSVRTPHKSARLVHARHSQPTGLSSAGSGDRVATID